MIDQNKRNTLKAIAVSGATFVGGSSFAALNSAASRYGDAIAGDDLELGNIEVTSRISALTNDLEVVLTNKGEQPVNITSMTPSRVRVARGEFDFDALLEQGPIVIPAGQSVAVPLQRQPMLRTSMSVPTLTESLQKSMSVITDNNALACVTIDCTAN